jgi:hypothetical protein
VPRDGHAGERAHRHARRLDDDRDRRRARVRGSAPAVDPTRGPRVGRAPRSGRRLERARPRVVRPAPCGPRATSS